MPKPILPPVGRVPCPTGDHEALVKYSHNRRRLFGHCKICGKFCEQDPAWIHERMTLDPEHLDKAPEGYQASIPPRQDPVQDNQETAAPDPDQDNQADTLPDPAARNQDNQGSIFTWL